MLINLSGYGELSLRECPQSKSRTLRMHGRMVSVIDTESKRDKSERERCSVCTGKRRVRNRQRSESTESTEISKEERDSCEHVHSSYRVA